MKSFRGIHEAGKVDLHLACKIIIPDSGRDHILAVLVRAPQLPVTLGIALKANHWLSKTSPPFPLDGYVSREYAYTEHFTFVRKGLMGTVLTAVIIAAAMGYLFLGRHALVGTFVVTVSTNKGNL